jgi:hypothetical protein
MTIIKYLNECINEGLGLEVVRAAATMQIVPTTARITVVSEESGHRAQTSFSKKNIAQHVVHATPS